MYLHLSVHAVFMLPVMFEEVKAARLIVLYQPSVGFQAPANCTMAEHNWCCLFRDLLLVIGVEQPIAIPLDYYITTLTQKV